MIEEARALLTETMALIERRQYEIARLTALRNSLEAFLDTPSPVDGDGEAALARETRLPTHPAAPPPAAGPRARRSSPAVRALGSFTCPEPGCSFLGRSRHALTIHAAKKHAPKVIVPADAPSGKVTYLCGRNCGRSFPSKERLNQHETLADCLPAPTRPPTSDATKFRINGKVAAGFVEGLGE